MRFEIFVFVLSAYYLSSVQSRAPRKFIPELVCKSNVIGPPCSNSKLGEPCKEGYTCRAGFCCRDRVCPKGWIGEESCNLIQGEKKCSDGYQCIGTFCCRPKKVIPPRRLCPKGTTPVPGRCRKFPFPYISFRRIPQCPEGSHCYRGKCCKTITNDGLCPDVKPAENCPVYKKNPDECQTNSDCLIKGVICCKDSCAVRRCLKTGPIY